LADLMVLRQFTSSSNPSSMAAVALTVRALTVTYFAGYAFLT